MKSKIFFTTFAVASVLLFSSFNAHGAAPSFLPLQGFLESTDGTPVDGDVNIHFTIYDAEVGGFTLWYETQNVHVEEGVFAAYLGEVEAIDLSMFRDNTNLWLGIQVESDPEMGRVYLASTPYTGYAEYCGNIPAHTHTYTEITGTVPDTSLPDGVVIGAQSCTGSDKVVGLDMSGALVCATDEDTTYLAGSGLSLTGTTFSVDTSVVQTRIAGNCSAGSAIRQINADGSVLCDAFLGAVGDQVLAGSLSVSGDVSAASFVSSDATARQSGELVFRGVMPVWEGSEVTITNAAAYQRVSGQGICLTCFTMAPPLPGTQRRLRFTVLYTDSQDSCGTDSSWVLAKHNDSSVVYASWTLPRTWSGSGLWHSRATDFFDDTIITNCTSSWANTCAIYAKLADTCTTHNMLVRGIYLEYYDQLP